MGSKLKTSVNGTDTGDVNREVSLKEGDLLKVGTTASVMRCDATVGVGRFLRFYRFNTRST